jgi:hypothetical protein
MAGFVAEMSSQGGMIEAVGTRLLGGGNTGLRLGILAAAVFPLAMAVTIPAFRERKAKRAV